MTPKDEINATLFCIVLAALTSEAEADMVAPLLKTRELALDDPDIVDIDVGEMELLPEVELIAELLDELVEVEVLITTALETEPEVDEEVMPLDCAIEPEALTASAAKEPTPQATLLPLGCVVWSGAVESPVALSMANLVVQVGSSPFRLNSMK